MNPPLAAIILSFLVPTLGLALILASVARWVGLHPRGLAWCAGLVLCSLVIVAAPLSGLPLARCLAGVVDHWSVPSTALLAAAGILARHMDGQRVFYGMKDQLAMKLCALVHNHLD